MYNVQEHARFMLQFNTLKFSAIDRVLFLFFFSLSKLYSWYINILWLFNSQAILVEERQ